MTCKVVTIVGARPQFIKAAAVSREILKHPGKIEEVMVHTGQHYDSNMSQVFFDELKIPTPKYNLEVSGGTHGVMTARMLEGIEKILLVEKPDWVLIYGDTNSTLAGALAAAKLHIPVAHVEAGLRSFNMRMPEEVNRILSDRVSTLLLCPTESAIDNLQREGITKGVANVGDVMFDVALHYRDIARSNSQILGTLRLSESAFVLATCHRAENTDSQERLSEILRGLAKIAQSVPVVLPIHPRTRKLIEDYGLEQWLEPLCVVQPLAFLDMVALEQAAKAIITDSGGVQKEAFFYQVPCITMRDETEWVETVQLGWNQLVGASCSRIVEAFEHIPNIVAHSQIAPYGDGFASRKIVEKLMSEYQR
ncbi:MULTISPECIES: non-hydrolyzing UDP-N-acetylglucosamine 2-epimerase [Pseudomonas]|uniref:UDP-2,3-diacetamido-2,3-dideoxy-D-glucuronate 2-epimerase n=1 Tax=Pseudomonas putida TaxID=303 RepID=A0A1B2F1K8_PSEPU|nr:MULTISPECIES: UDP-N-acetylglucosamine 2-epimerase (non-hydrolyzing) [Pseudomonas]ANY86033.1 UDP-2,3-diacetamido-2,3-dideoxy-D-glucuronate 2-epimerase [Pseudomonas putida]